MLKLLKVICLKTEKYNDQLNHFGTAQYQCKINSFLLTASAKKILYTNNFQFIYGKVQNNYLKKKCSG